MRLRDRMLLWSLVVIWSAVGGGMLVNKAYTQRGVLVVERVVYKDHPFMAEVEKYSRIMEQLNVGTRMASAPLEIKVEQRAPVVHAPHPRRRPTAHVSPDHGRKLEDVIALAEAGL